MKSSRQELHEFASSLRDISEEILTLLFHRYVFRTFQEIVRSNSRLRGPVRGRFSEWTQVLFSVASAMTVRRLAGRHRDGDVSFAALFDKMIQAPNALWPRFEKHFPTDVRKGRTAASRPLTGPNSLEQCRRLLQADRQRLMNAANQSMPFASKRAAHNNPGAEVRTTFHDIDESIDALRDLCEKYTLLIFDQRIDLLQEMRSRKLPDGWDDIFLEPWATREMLAPNLGERQPPMRRG